jgi:hypothetical protein
MKTPMPDRVRNYGSVCVVIYYAIFATALLFAIETHTKAPLVGVYPMFVTLPWSLVVFMVTDKAGLTTVNPWLLLVVCSIPNAMLLYKVGYDNTKYKRQQMTSASTINREES